MKSRMIKTSLLSLAIGLGAAHAAHAGTGDRDINVKAVKSCLADIQELETVYKESKTPIPESLRRDEHALRAAALTLARNGRKDGCEAIVEEIEELRESYEERQEEAAEREARMKRIANSVPLTGPNGMVRAELIQGAEIVNLQNQSLGHVESVLLSGGPAGRAYVMVSHGGFLGIGEDLTPVRLSDLKRAAEGEDLILDVDAAKFAEAPNVELGDDDMPADDGWIVGVGAWWDGLAASK